MGEVRPNPETLLRKVNNSERQDKRGVVNVLEVNLALDGILE